MAKEEGVTSLWKGSVANIMRSAALTAGQLCTNAQITEMLQDRYGYDPYSIQTKVLAKGMAGFFAAFLSLPFDNMKVRM